MHSIDDITLCVTAFNEEMNLPKLFEDFDLLATCFPGLKVCVRDNNSTDGTQALGMSLALKRPYVEFLSGKENLGYGGGMRAAALSSDTTYVALIPADRQYPISSIIGAISRWLNMEHEVLVGHRATRTDGLLASIQSSVYSILCRSILELNVRDINGLPKIFPRRFLAKENFPYSQTFFFDAQILVIAKTEGYEIEQFDVGFERRKSGISSWTNRRLKTILGVLSEIAVFKRRVREADFA